MIDPKCRQCRAAGEKLFLKGERCFSPKCAIVRRPYRPGVHGQSRRRALSEFALGLLEKQKMKRAYGLRERQFRAYFEEASTKKSGVLSSFSPADMVLIALERRLDNVVFRLGYAPSRNAASQIVSHGHLLVNGTRVNVPSYEVKIGDALSIRPASAKMAIFSSLKDTLKKHKTPDWLVLDLKTTDGKMKTLPVPAAVGMTYNIALIIDHYSR